VSMIPLQCGCAVLQDVRKARYPENSTGRHFGTGPQSPQVATRLEANPPYGEKRDFVKMTVTLPPVVYELLAQEAIRRKMAKERDPLLSAIIREAVVAHLETGKATG